MNHFLSFLNRFLNRFRPVSMGCRKGRLLGCVALGLPYLALAQDQPFAPEQLRPAETDISVRLLNCLLGSAIDKIRLADTLTGADNGPFGDLFQLLNSFLLLVLGLLLFVKAVLAVLDTAHEGEALGAERSTVWTPLRIVSAVVLLVPMINGMALAQVLVLWITLGGVGLANAVWDQAVDQFSKAALYTEPPPAQARQLAVAMLASNVCELIVNDIPARGPTRYRVTFQAETTSVGTVTERAARWSSDDLGEAVCGGFAVREPAEGIDFRQSVAGIDWLDRFTLWIQELVGYGQATREAFGQELLAAHEIAALAMRKELQPLAKAIFDSQADLGECVTVTTGPLPGGRCLSLLDVAAEHYATRLKSLIKGVIDLTGQRAFTEFTAKAKAEGWMTAGSWFYRFMALTDYMNKLALNVPQPYPIRVWEKLPKEDVETYAHLFKRLEAVVLEAETETGAGVLRSSGDPENSVLDDVSHHLLRSTLEWILQTLVGKTHPLFAIAWLGHALLATILGALAAAGAIGAAKYIATKSGAGRVASALGGLADTLTGGGQTGGGFTMLSLVLGMMLLALLGFALMAAIYIPLVPFIIWTITGLKWLIRVFEALIAAPVWALWFIKNGRGLTGEAMPGWIALFSLLLMPSLMVIGLLAATVISYALLSVMTGTFLTVAVNAMSGNVTGPIILAGLLIVFFGWATDLTLRSFSLIHRLPDAALRWVGGHAEEGVEHMPLQHTIDAANRTGVRTALEASKEIKSQKPLAKVKPMGDVKDSD